MDYLSLFSFVLLVFTLGNSVSLPYEELYKLDIVHYSDFHARFEETSVEAPTCRFNNNSCLGGFPRLYHQIQLLLQEKPDALLLNAGDSFQGTYWYTLLKWNVTQEFMNLLPHDAHAIGNHEFDDGPAGLAPYLSALKAPVLVANMDTSKEPLLQGLYKPSIIIRRRGRRIGLIGLITTYTKTRSSPGKVTFTDPGEATRREVKKLTRQGVDIIILLSHCGLQVDKKLARDHGQHIDIIIGGHSHLLLWNGPAPSGEEVTGPYPAFIQSTDDKKHKVLIVHASAFTKYIGNLSVFFDSRGDYVKWEGGPIFLNRSIPEDEVIKAKLAPYRKLIHEAKNVPIGETISTLNYKDCVFGECALGDLLVESFNEYAKSVLKADTDYISFIQRGNMRSSIHKRAISKGTLFDVLSYNDGVETFQLKGKFVLEALERSVQDVWSYKPFKGPWVLQVSGVCVEYNVSLPEGHRVTSATIGQCDKNDGRENLNPHKMYQVTVPAYLARGGDGYSMILKHKENVQVIGRDQKIFEDYIRRKSPLNVTTDGRIVIRC